MPTYEYRCRSCGEQLEVVQAFTDDALTTHDACGGELRKVFGSVGISFKGSGFYKNDSRGKSSSTSTSSESGSSSGDKGDAASGSSDKKSSGASDKNGASTPATSDKTKSASSSTPSGSTTSTPA